MKIDAPKGYEVPITLQTKEIKTRYCLYARKSTESEERQVLSIDSQIKEMLELAEREGLEIVAMKRESHSAKEQGQRPVFNEIVDEIKAKKYNAILTWAPDRISRNAGDLGKIVETLHPTPAVSGYPTKEASVWLQKIEPPRGMYAGLVGYITHNEVELAVTIRCGFLSQQEMQVMTGVGVVEESDVESEWSELDGKLMQILEGAVV